MSRHQGQRSQRVRGLARLGVEMRDGTIGGTQAREPAVNGKPVAKPYHWRGDQPQPDARQLDAHNRARMVTARRAKLAEALDTAATVNADGILAAADAYAAAAVYATGTFDTAAVVRAALDGWHPCHCLCAIAHPGQEGLCQALSAVTVREVAGRDAPVCAPCFDAAEADQ